MSGVLCVTLSLCIGADGGPSDGTDVNVKEVRALVGFWQDASADAGKDDPPLCIGFLKNKADLDRMSREKHLIGIRSVDTGTAPHRIDAVLITVGGASEFRGIYSLEKGVLKICYNKRGGDRPQEFSEIPDKRSLLVLKKVK